MLPSAMDLYLKIFTYICIIYQYMLHIKIVYTLDNHVIWKVTMMLKIK